MSAVLKPKKSKSVKERVSKEEWQLRVDLAAAYQCAAIYKWTDMIFTHFSARLPGQDEFLINALSVMCPYGPEEKQALLEAKDLRSRAEVLVALAEIDLASNGSSGTTLQ